MIISHRYKFIFLKTNKTAGTSIEIALSKFCGPEDIIAPVSPEDEILRRKLGYPGPQNYLAPIWSYSFRELFRLLTRGEKKRRFFNHITAGEVKNLIGKPKWDSYFKFCFERNPWDRIISQYYWKHQSEPRPPISDFISSMYIRSLKKKGYMIYTIDGRIAVDRVCKFEKIHEELEAVRKQVGIADQIKLPHTKSHHRKDKRSYRDIFGEEDKAKIADLFRYEIDSFGYKW